MPSMAVAEPDLSGACGAERRLPLVSALARTAQHRQVTWASGDQRGESRTCCKHQTGHGHSLQTCCIVLSSTTMDSSFSACIYLCRCRCRAPSSSPGTVHDCTSPASASRTIATPLSPSPVPDVSRSTHVSPSTGSLQTTDAGTHQE